MLLSKEAVVSEDNNLFCSIATKFTFKNSNWVRDFWSSFPQLEPQNGSFHDFSTAYPL